MSPETDAKSGPTSQAEVRGVLPPGTRLRTYEVVSILGQGAFGITYRARDTTLNRDVAIKEYLPSSLALREDGTMVVPRSTELAEDFVWGRDRFLDEARTLASLEHAAAVVRVMDFLEANGTAYMVMALVRGETLDRRLRQEGRLGPSLIARIMEPLMDGLEQVHQASFLHRDIKPSNIIVDARDAPTLIDFGASRAAVAGRSMTLTAVFTPGYAAPEQFGSSSQGPWTDIYGLSATLYHAMTGVVPPNSVDRILEDTYRPLVQLAPHGFSPAVLAAIDAGLLVRALQRPQNIAEWRALLRQEALPRSAATVAMPRARPAPSPSDPATPGPVSASPAPPPLPAAAAPAVARDAALPAAAVRASPPRRGPLLWGSAVLALLLVAGGGYLALRSSGPATVGVDSLTAKELEQALAERRKAEAVTAEMKRLEDDAARKAAADAEAKRKADSELEMARQQRQRAEEELAKLKAEAEARQRADEAQTSQAAAAAKRAQEEAAAQRKAEAEIAALRKAAEEASKKAEEEAQAKRQVDEGARRKLEAEAAASRATEKEAQRKAAVEAEIKRQADQALAKAQADREKADADARTKAEIDAKKRAEMAEQALNLPTGERQRLQVALTSLGFDTRGSDGTFGPRSRDMIMAWQKARNEPATGFLSAAQQQALLREAAVAVSRYDDEQKKSAEEKKKAEDEAKAKAATIAPPAPAPLADNRMLEQKSVTAYKTNGLAGTCGSNFNYSIRVYRNGIDLQLGGAWRQARSDAQGKFDSGVFTSATSGNKFRITGNMAERAVSIENLTIYCAWRATF